MPTTPIISFESGPQVTVNDWISDPYRVPRYTLDLMKQGFLVDAVLRTEGNCPAGIVRYEESNPLYGGNVIEDRAEFGEIPVGRFGLGTPKVAFSRDKSIGVVVSEEMHDRNNIDMMAQGMKQVANDMTKTWDDLFVGMALAHPQAQTFAAASPWSTVDYDVRADLLSCMKSIDSAQDSQGSELGFTCDTLIVSRTTKFDLLRSKEFNAEYYGGNIADQNLRYTGTLPQQIMGLDVLVSPRVPVGKAIFLQRKVAGFISDEKPLFSTPLRYDEDRPAWRADIRRKAAVALDQPRALLVASNVS